MGDLRKFARIPWSGRVSITWTDRYGNPVSGWGEVVNLSAKGMRIRMKSPLQVREFVSIHCQKPGLYGSASVRSCVHAQMNYFVGLEFAGGLNCDIDKLTPQ